MNSQSSGQMTGNAVKMMAATAAGQASRVGMAAMWKHLVNDLRVNSGRRATMAQSAAVTAKRRMNRAARLAW